MSDRTIEKHTVAQHAARIEAAYKKTGDAFFELVIAVKEASDELGEKTFRKELADQLSISKGTLSKLLHIGGCAVLIRRKDSLPPTLTTLYALAQTHSVLVDAYGQHKADEELGEILEDVDKKTEAKDIQDALKQAKQRAATALRKDKVKAEGASDKWHLSPKAGPEGVTTFAHLIETEAAFRTVFMVPPPEVLDWALDAAVFLDRDMNAKFPVRDMLASAREETIQGFVYCPASRIYAGLRFLQAAGFHFKDIFSPAIGTKGFDLLRDHKVLLRGERGPASEPTCQWRPKLPHFWRTKIPQSGGLGDQPAT